MHVPTFYGRINPRPALALGADQLRAYEMWLATLVGKDVEVVVRERRAKRSNAQNAWWWGVAVPAIASAVGYEKDDKAGHELVHYALVEKHFGTEWNDKLKADVPKKRSSRLDTKEFAELMEWAVRFAATEWGLYIEMPDEVKRPHERTDDHDEDDDTADSAGRRAGEPGAEGEAHGHARH